MGDTIEVMVEASSLEIQQFVLREAIRLLMKRHGDVCGHGDTGAPLEVRTG